LVAGPELRAETLDAPNDKFSVSTFGHGTHACPGRAFALMVIKMVTCRYLTELSLEPQFASPKVPPASVGAVARSESECVVCFAAVKRGA
jgi:cytochrome P450